MSFIRGGETITIKRRSKASTDDYGNTTHSLTSIIVKDVLVALGGGSEPVLTDRDPVDQSITVYLPNGTRVEDGDRFVIRGVEFVKAGPHQDWSSPFGPQFETGVVVSLRRRNG